MQGVTLLLPLKRLITLDTICDNRSFLKIRKQLPDVCQNNENIHVYNLKILLVVVFIIITTTMIDITIKT